MNRLRLTKRSFFTPIRAKRVDSAEGIDRAKIQTNLRFDISEALSERKISAHCDGT